MREDMSGEPAARGARQGEAQMLRARIEALLEHRYTLLELIGQDGSELCFRARDPRMGETVVLVTILIESAVLGGASLRLPSWVQTVNSVSHHALPRVIDWGIGSGLVYYVVRADVPATLELVMSSGESVEFEHAERMLADVAGALDTLHSAGLRHGSLNPGCILVSGSRKSALVIGSGLVDMLRKDPELAPSVPVSPAYVAPELWTHGGSSNGRADQYALAVIAYELMTGRRRAAIDHATGMMTIEPVHVPLGVAMREGIPLHVNTALSRAFSPRANLRYSSASEFVSVLNGDAPATPESMKTEHPGLRAPRHAQTAALVSLLGLFFVVASVAMLIFLPEERAQVAQSGRSFALTVKELPVRIGLSPPPSGAASRQVGTRSTAGSEPGAAQPIEPFPAAMAGRIGAAVSSVFESRADTAARSGGSTPARQVAGGGTTVVQMGFVSVTSDLGGGTVYVDNSAAGRAPHVARLRTGEHAISMRSPDYDYDPATAAVRITAGDTVRIHFTARPRSAP